MDLVRLTRRLVDIESITGNEAAVGEFLLRELTAHGWRATAMPVEGTRFNVLATSGAPPRLVFSTHMDTVPPFIASSEDGERIWGRGACDAKGIIAAQIAAAERLRDEGAAVGLLFLVGEERDSAGAVAANAHSAGSEFLINGEPTENRLAVATKGALRLELEAKGSMAHSAYPELGESATEKLVLALARLLQMDLPKDAELGATTMNIGVIAGGRAPNVVADHARAEVMYRLVTPADGLKRRINDAVGNLVDVEVVLETPLVRLRTLPGFPTMVAAFTTDIPCLTNWGEPLLFGPGSIHMAHTEREHIEKLQLTAAVDLYCQVAQRLLRGDISTLPRR